MNDFDVCDLWCEVCERHITVLVSICEFSVIFI